MRAVRLEVHPYHRGVGHAAGEHLVEVVGDPSGEGADGLHPLGLVQLLLQLSMCALGLDLLEVEAQDVGERKGNTNRGDNG